MTIEDAAVDLRERMAPTLPEGLLAHIDRVVEIASRLAEAHGGDVALARLMAQGHDVLRHVPPEDLLARAEAAGLEIDLSERHDPVLLHGPLGAIELRERYGIEDERVLHAIHWHTPGHPDYGIEAWSMFIADKIDPRKVRRWHALRRVRREAPESLHRAAVLYLDRVTKRAIREGWMLHPMATVTRNALLQRLEDAR
ncbi:MAG: bis(5'-nucleosyl)-tetraphosphatase (symmetrical) YqeK [Dehalococcoidia bacterium]